METLNCMRCKYRHEVNGNCTAVGGFCTDVTAAHCPLLRKYLDTGMTPERCAEFARADAEGRYIVMRDAEQEGVASLRELAEADKDGRVVVLPCKVGDTVYFALLGRIIEKQVFSIVSFSNSTRIYCGGTSEYFRPEDIGKSFFLTREEAEKALQEMEGKEKGATNERPAV